MCGRYTYGISEKDVKEVVEYVDSLLKNKTFGKDICPTDYAPVIVSTDKGITLTQKKWGYQGIEGKGTIINAKAETVLDKRMFASGISRHRAVIPASGFYEWNGMREKSTFTRFNESVMYMAGFFDHFEGEDGYIIITTAANDSMKAVHDRMPLILEQNQINEWLTNDDAVGRILKQASPELDRSCDYEQLSLF